MKSGILKLVLILIGLNIGSDLIADDLLDVITLKNNKAVIKGFISEQIPGVTVTVIPMEATLKINYDTIINVSTKKLNPKDSVSLDVITLKGGTSIEGSIIEKSPNKWYLIKSYVLAPQTFKYNEIEKLGKETTNNCDIFKAYGIIDILTTKNEIYKGIILEQVIGKTIKIITTHKAVIVLDVADVLSIGREAHDAKKDIFKQSAFIDVVHKIKGGTARGIIIRQIPGESVIVEYPANGGNSDPIPYSEILKISKEINMLKEKAENVQMKVVEEPDSIGVCIYNENNIKRQINGYKFQFSKKNDFITLIKAPIKAIDIFKLNKEISFIVKVGNNVDDIIPTIQIWDIIASTKLPKIITVPKSSNNVKDYIINKQDNTTLKIEKYGNASVKLTLIPNKKGEYAIIYKGCPKVIVFGIE